MDKNGRFQRSGFLFGVLLLLIFLISPFIIVFAQWEDAEISRLTENEFSNSLIRLVMSKNDRLFLLYREYTTHVVGGPYKILLMTKEAGQNWSAPELVGDTSCHLGEGCTYVVSMDPPTEIIHLIYYEGDKIYYSNSQRENWQKDLLDSGYKYCVNIAFDSLDNVHLAWAKLYTFAGLNYFSIYYATNASGEWVNQVISPDICTYWSEGGCPTIAVKREGIAHIIYPGPVYMNHAWNNALGGTTWTTRFITPPPVAHDSYGTSSFTIDRNDKLHMTIHTYLYEPARNRELYYPWVEDTGWGEPEEITNTGSIEHLFVDRQGEVHVVWSRISGDINYRDMYYAHKEGDEWVSYQILDHYEYYANPLFHFGIDSEGKGYAAFSGIYYDPVYDPWDSSEIFYFGPPATLVPDTIVEEQIGTFQLFQNYPNPFNNTTIIPFTVTRSQVNGSQFIVNSPTHATQQSVNSSQLMVHSPLRTTLVIYNILGEKVRILVDDDKWPGEYQVTWDGKNDSGKEVSSGVYFCKLKVGDFSEIRKLVLIK